MSKENGTPSAAEKGKGKIEDDKSADASKKVDETRKDKDGKPVVNGKKGEEPQDGTCHTCGFVPQSTDYVLSSVEELNEEDQQLKTELEMLVSRLKVESPASETVQLNSYMPPIGIRYRPLHSCARCNQRFYQNIDIINDCRPKTSKVSSTPL